MVLIYNELFEIFEFPRGIIEFAFERLNYDIRTVTSIAVKIMKPRALESPYAFNTEQAALIPSLSIIKRALYTRPNKIDKSFAF